jgi:hypothetical protein
MFDNEALSQDIHIAVFETVVESDIKKQSHGSGSSYVGSVHF